VDDAFDLLKRPGRCVDVGAAELGRERVPAAEDVEGKVAVGVVVAVEEPALLVPVQRDVGRAQVEDDLPGRGAVRVQEQRSTNSASIPAASWPMRCSTTRPRALERVGPPPGGRL
jgi:hypothetical protein